MKVKTDNHYSHRYQSAFSKCWWQVWEKSLSFCSGSDLTSLIWKFQSRRILTLVYSLIWSSCQSRTYRVASQQFRLHLNFYLSWAFKKTYCLIFVQDNVIRISYWKPSSNPCNRVCALCEYLTISLIYPVPVFSKRHFSGLLFNEKFIQAQRWTFSICHGRHSPQNAPEKQYKSLATWVRKVGFKNVPELTIYAFLVLDWK